MSRFRFLTVLFVLCNTGLMPVFVVNLKTIRI